MRSALAALLLAGCDVIFPLTEPTSDATPAPDAEVLPTTRCFGTDLVQLCLESAPDQPFAVSATAGELMLDTDVATCLPYTVENATEDPGACVIAATRVEIDGTLRAIGSKPLVLVASIAMRISGTVDVSSSRVRSLVGPGALDAASGPDCGFQAATQGGGGPGGSFGGRGGNGGDRVSPAGAGGIAMSKSPPTRLRGGCRGGGGGGTLNSSGQGGGAIALIAPAIEITATGVVNASGEAAGGGFGLGTGNCPATGGCGGGGAGSGGMILLDGTLVGTEGAIVFANGGGGGQGGGVMPGTSACDGTASTSADMPGLGGGDLLSCNSMSGGRGGDGSVLDSLAGQSGSPGSINGGAGGGGGGGGGGAGVIRVAPVGQQTSVRFAPPPSS